MPASNLFQRCFLPVILVLIAVASAFATPREKVLYRFKNDGSRGAYPASVLIFDSAGDLYGTTPSGGPGASGVAFKLIPPATKGGSWTQRIIHSFLGETPPADGPFAGLVADGKGNLYGTTLGGGTTGWGFVFRLSPPVSKGAPWKETVLYSFQGGGDGGRSYGNLIFDSSGSLYGTTSNGGITEYGTVFRLTPTQHGWSETVLYRFTGAVDGAAPTSGLVMDRQGNLYGTTLNGGKFGMGVAFEVSRPAGPGKTWKETVLHHFCSRRNCLDGANPWAGLAIDGKGKLYGTTYFGGANQNCGFAVETCGTVFQLAPPKQKGEAWTETVLSGFASGGGDGFFPWSTPILDGKGNLYGTTELGGLVGSHCNFGCGVVFELTPPRTRNGFWTEIVLHKFEGQVGLDEGISMTGVVMDRAGNLFGDTAYIQTTGVGTVFEVTP